MTRRFTSEYPPEFRPEGCAFGPSGRPSRRSVPLANAHTKARGQAAPKTSAGR